MRSEAKVAIAKLAGGRSETAVTCIQAYLTSSNAAVRRVACDSLGDIAPSGSKKTVALICTSIADEDEPTRDAATKALLKVASKGDMYALEEASKGLSHWFSEVRVSVVKAMMALCDRSVSDRVANMLQARYKDETNTDV